MHRRAVLSVAVVAVSVLTAGGAALALLGGPAAEAIQDEEILFDVGEAGSVIVSSDGSGLRVVGVSTSHGWVHRIAEGSGDSVGVVFVAADMGIDFEASLDDTSVVGRIRILADPPSEGSPSDGATVSTPSGVAVDPPSGNVGSPAPSTQPQDPALQPATAASEQATSEAGPNHLGADGIGMAYGKVTGDTPIIDPVLDQQPDG